MGDGVLLEFPSVVAAVECAILIQKMMAERNGALPEAKRILYRIGVNLGDVLVEGDDILGDGVNIAARLEGICEAGGMLRLRLSLRARPRPDRGRVRRSLRAAIKNIARSVRAYALRPLHRGDEVRRPGPVSPFAPENRAPPRLSMVVLPFANIGGDPEP